jgi:hypothetical protein
MAQRDRRLFDKGIQQLCTEDDLISRTIAPGPSDPSGRLVPTEAQDAGVAAAVDRFALGDSPVAILCEHSGFSVPAEYNVRCFASASADMFDHIAEVGALLIIYIGHEAGSDYVHECGRIFDMVVSEHEHMICLVCPQFWNSRRA